VIGWLLASLLAASVLWPTKGITTAAFDRTLRVLLALQALLGAALSLHALASGRAELALVAVAIGVAAALRLSTRPRRKKRGFVVLVPNDDVPMRSRVLSHVLEAPRDHRLS
jgi:hypothetical protein